MATKTISLELDAYEKLRRAKRGGESFSAVVRRAVLDTTGETDLHLGEGRSGYGSEVGSPELKSSYRLRLQAGERAREAVESFDEATRRQAHRNQLWRKRLSKKGQRSKRGWNREDLYEGRGTAR